MLGKASELENQRRQIRKDAKKAFLSLPQIPSSPDLLLLQLPLPCIEPAISKWFLADTCLIIRFLPLQPCFVSHHRAILEHTNWSPARWNGTSPERHLMHFSSTYPSINGTNLQLVWNKTPLLAYRVEVGLSTSWFTLKILSYRPMLLTNTDTA